MTTVRMIMNVANMLLQLSCALGSFAQHAPGQVPANPNNRSANTSSVRPSTERPIYRKAFVIDDRLSVLRRKPGLQGEVIRRLRVGYAVFIVGTAKTNLRAPSISGSPSISGEARFVRVAVSRRTRGWIHASALAVPDRAGDDQRIMKLIETSENVDKIVLCRLLNERFAKSRSLPRAMLLLGEEAERIAEVLSQRTRRRLGEVRGAMTSVRDYYLSDAGLDRYSKLGVVFDFDDSTGEFSYDGKAYRDVIRRFPRSQEATLARQRLERNSQKTTTSR